MDSTRDFEKGFFQYQVRCRLLKGDMVITEGLGACNTREKKISKDGSIHNGQHSAEDGEEKGVG